VREDVGKAGRKERKGKEGEFEEING